MCLNDFPRHISRKLPKYLARPSSGLQPHKKQLIATLLLGEEFEPEPAHAG